MAPASSTETPWHAAYPSPTNASPATITRDEVLEILKGEDGTTCPSYVLVDLRRTDHEGGTIHGSINLPAQSLYPSIPTLYKLFKTAGIKNVIWYCGSSQGRGTRATGWFSDHLKNHSDEEMKSHALLGGIKGWAAAGGEFVQYMNEYDASFWSK
ncbi:hypothetical protein TruAng_009999 [Truncatella angustata]|nr:hypothetical protein TruAng_009999 [Truncatella angustata]